MEKDTDVYLLSRFLSFRALLLTKRERGKETKRKKGVRNPREEEIEEERGEERGGG